MLNPVNGYMLLTPLDDLDEYERMFQTNSDLALQHTSKGKLIAWDETEPGFLEYHQLNKGMDCVELDLNSDTLFYFKPFAGTYFKEKNMVAVKIDDILYYEEPN